MDSADSLKACIAELTGEAPGPDEDAATFLAARGLGVVEVADPGAFGWPGRFLGRRGDAWAVWFGVPPGVIHDPAGIEPGAPEQVLVLAPHRLDTPSAARTAAGRVEAIGVASHAEGPMRSLPEVTAHAGRGLDGDRYAEQSGTFSSKPGNGRDLTLIESEALDGLFDDPLTARRNVVVSGLDLDSLLGRRFRVGDVECVGRRRCEPCAHLQRLTEPGVLRALVHRGGLRADIVSDGVIRLGDVVEALDPSSEL